MPKSSKTASLQFHPESKSPVDFASLRMLTEVGTQQGVDFITKRITDFHILGRQFLNLMENSIEKSDWEQAGSLAKELKSVAGLVGAHRVFNLCLEMDLVLKTENKDDSYSMMQSLLKEHQVAAAILGNMQERAVG